MFRFFIRLSLSFVMLVIVQVPDASAEKDVQWYMKKAQSFVRFRNYTSAVKMLKKALTKDKDNGDLYYNIGLVAEKGRMWSDALLYFQGYLAMDNQAPDKKKVLKSIERITKKKLKGKVATLNLTTTQPGVEFFVNGALVGSSKTAMARLYPGSYRVVARKKDHTDLTMEVTLGAGDNKTLSASLKVIEFPGWVEVKTTPAVGVVVYLDNQKKGVTPLVKFKVKAKTRYLITLKKKGYDNFVRYVTVPKNTTHKLSATLSKPE